jgi:hypothetical protein
MKRMVWKKVKVMPALMEIFWCDRCHKTKFELMEDHCGCAELDEYWNKLDPTGVMRRQLSS